MLNTWKLTSSQKDRIIWQYNLGEPVTGIARQYNVTRQSISALLKRRNIKVRDNRRNGCRINETAFDTISADMAYWVGFLMADGNIYNNTIGIFLNTQDIGHLGKFRKFIGGTQQIYKHKTRPACSYQFQSNYMVQKLALLGIVPNKSSIEKPPDCFLDNRHFWRGMIDGDGWVTSTRLGLCGSYETIKQFAAFIEQNIVKHSCHPCKAKSIFQIRFRGDKAKRIVTELYSKQTIALDRKEEKAQIWMV